MPEEIEERNEKLKALIEKVKTGGATLSIMKACEIREGISENTGYKPNDKVLVVRNSGKIKEILGFVDNSLAADLERFKK